MFRKVALGALLVGLVGFLVTGAMIRTTARVAQAGESQGQSHGPGGAAQGAAGVEGAGQPGYGGQRRQAAPADEAGSEHATGEAWLTLEGTVVRVDVDGLAVAFPNGEGVLLEGRSWAFAQEQGLSPQISDRVTLVGFYEDHEFKAGWLENTTTAQIVRLRDESGRPLWAGRGRGGQG